MLQRTTISSATLDLQQADLRQLIGGSRIGRVGQLVREMLWLPNDFASFLLFLGVISLLTAGLMLHLGLSVEILEMRLLLESKQKHQAEIERQSAEIVWQIGQAMSLDRVGQRASALGYVVPTQRYYVDASSELSAATASTPGLSTPARVDSTVDASEPILGAGASQKQALEISALGRRTFGRTVQQGWQDLSHQVAVWWQGS